MPAILTTAAEARREPYDAWCAIGCSPTLDPARRIEELGRWFERARDDIRGEWFALARELGADPSAAYSHMPSCVANASDFGLMLAWTRLVDAWAVGSRAVLVVCNDPWLFRHLAGRPGVHSRRPPPLWSAELGLRARGFLARVFVSARAFVAALRFGGRDDVRGGAWILSYNHPASRRDGFDAYFGDLMTEMLDLRRALHVDGPIARARGHCDSARTLSLHVYGSALVALELWRARWRPVVAGPHAWLIRRAEAREVGTGQAAAIAWQIHCQERWLARAQPAVVAWPWENHAWERALTRACRRSGVKTIGYQHTTIGTHEWNYALASNPDAASVPDRILCSGPAGLRRLRAFGHDPSRLAIAGARRIPKLAALPHDPAGPVFVALPNDHMVAAEMVAAIRPLAREGLRFVVRSHPMTPFPFAEEAGVSRAAGPLAEHRGVAAVLYAATTVGLEAALGGLPTVRFLPKSAIANDVLPDGYELPAAGEGLGAALRAAVPPPPLDPGSIFAPVAHEVWREALRAEARS
jgi:hypothetical protein